MKRRYLVTSMVLAGLLFGGCASNNRTTTTTQDTQEAQESSSSQSSSEVALEESNESSVEEEVAKITPYVRVASVAGGWEIVDDLALHIATSVVENDESQTLNYPTNWVIAGANPEKDETFEAYDVLGVPLGESGNKGRVIELCNKAYASMAMNTGRFHASALPCEVSVHSDGNTTYIDMLNPEAIFSIFFADYNDTTGGMKQIASNVKSEIQGMILEAIKEHEHKSLEENLGPKYSDDEIATLSSPYLIYHYKNGSTFTKGVDDRAVAKALIETLGSESAPSTLEGLSEGAGWRSAREEPIAIPNAQVVEACSPKYAKKATSLGSEYLTALPCEFAVYVDENDESNQTLSVSVLNPEFMFGTMFKGAIEKALAERKITEAQMQEYVTLPEVVKNDLLHLLNHVVTEHNLQSQN